MDKGGDGVDRRATRIRAGLLIQPAIQIRDHIAHMVRITRNGHTYFLLIQPAIQIRGPLLETILANAHIVCIPYMVRIRAWSLDTTCDTDTRDHIAHIVW